MEGELLWLLGKQKFILNSSALYLHRSLYRQIVGHGNEVSSDLQRLNQERESHQIFLRDFMELYH